MDRIFEQLCNEHGLHPVAEYRFHPVRRWRVDYYFEAKNRVALEVEGGVYIQGRHTRASGFVKDMAKYNNLAMQGIYLLRVQPKDLYSVETIEMIKATLIVN